MPEDATRRISNAFSTIDQLRSDIDHGRTGDKVDFPDPAAAPLGTDEEAAGTPIDPRDVTSTRLRERARYRQPPRRELGLMSASVLIVAAFLTGFLTWLLLR
jgi:hypothetical protein